MSLASPKKVGEMEYTPPEIISGVTKLDKDFFDNLFLGINSAKLLPIFDPITWQPVPDTEPIPLEVLVNMAYYAGALSAKFLISQEGPQTVIINPEILIYTEEPPEESVQENQIYAVIQPDGELKLRLPKFTPPASA